jgi:hypothetical protein
MPNAESKTTRPIKREKITEVDSSIVKEKAAIPETIEVNTINPR